MSLTIPRISLKFSLCILSIVSRTTPRTPASEVTGDVVVLGVVVGGVDEGLDVGGSEGVGVEGSSNNPRTYLARLVRSVIHDQTRSPLSSSSIGVVTMRSPCSSVPTDQLP